MFRRVVEESQVVLENVLWVSERDAATMLPVARKVRRDNTDLEGTESSAEADRQKERQARPDRRSDTMVE
jgi:hypothetical protein